jgi:hypothetical protein
MSSFFLCRPTPSLSFELHFLIHFSYYQSVLLHMMCRQIHRQNYIYTHSFCLLNFVLPAFRPDVAKFPTPYRRLNGPGIDNCQHADETLYLLHHGRRDAVIYSETFVRVYQTTRCHIPEHILIFTALRTFNLIFV